MDDTETLETLYKPTSSRPLLGLTVLVVEDSKLACDALRLMCLRSGARIRRADCLRSARRHLQVYRPSVVIVDLGLPDGSGADLIGELDQTSPRVGIILGISGDSSARALAFAAGADAFLEKPFESMLAFQTAIISQLPIDRRPEGPRIVAEDTFQPDPVSYRDDMAHAADVLGDAVDTRSVDYVAQFLTGVARAAGDHALVTAAEALADARSLGQPIQARVALLAGLVQDRLSDRLAI